MREWHSTLGALLLVIALVSSSAVKVNGSGLDSLSEAGLPEKIVYAWHYDPSGKASYVRHRSYITHNCPVWYGISDDLEIIGPTDIDVGSRSNKLILYVGDSREERILEYLKDPNRRALLAKNIFDAVIRWGFDGVNIDIEFHAPNASYREYFTDFIANLSEKLRGHGKLLSVDVPAKTSDAEEGWCGAFDYGRLGMYVDHLVLMAYDYCSSATPPGPIAPTGWIEKVIDYALSCVDRRKIVLGIPFYGYDWSLDSSGKWRGNPITHESARGLISLHDSTVLWNYTFGGLESNEPYFRYREGGVEHIVFFQNGESIRRKLEVADSRYIRGIAIWHLGGEDEENWKHIGEWRRILKLFVRVSGIEGCAPISLNISGMAIALECNGLKISLEEGVEHTISVDRYIQVAPGVRYFCQRNSILVPRDPPPYAFEYRRQYKLNVDSPHGSTAGSGWYDEGSTATFSIRYAFPFSFEGWCGDSNATTPSATILMDGPKEVRAKLGIDWTLLAMAFSPLACAFLAIFCARKLGRRFKSKQIPNMEGTEASPRIGDWMD